MNLFSQIMKKHSRSLTHTDLKSLVKWCGTESHDYSVLKTKRTHRVVDEFKKVMDELHSGISLYNMIAPHTFCFAPFDESRDRSVLENKMNDRFLDSKSLLDAGAGWVHTGRTRIYTCNEHSINLGLYLSTDKHGLKIKFYSKHSDEEGSSDILDVEANFVGNKYLGVVHYHVIKPCTLKRLSETDKTGITFPYFFEMSLTPRNGKVRIKHCLENRGEKSILTEKESLKNSFKALQLLDDYPVVSGGTWFAEAINVIRNEPKYEALQHMVVRRYNPERFHDI